MRWGIFSDIHANLEALNAVLKSFSQEKIDTFVCLGDIVGYGANPCECIKEVKKCNPILVAGNHDWAACGQVDTSNFNPRAYEAVKWTSNIISSEDKNFLKNLELMQVHNEITFVHANPSHPEEFEYILSERCAYYALGVSRTQLCFIGHSHLPFIYVMGDNVSGFSPSSCVDIKSSRRYLINVGSVGQPRDGNAYAAYGIYDSYRGEISIKRVKYDVERAANKIIKAGLPPALAQRLGVGR